MMSWFFLMIDEVIMVFCSFFFHFSLCWPLDLPFTALLVLMSASSMTSLVTLWPTGSCCGYKQYLRWPASPQQLHWRCVPLEVMYFSIVNISLWKSSVFIHIHTHTPQLLICKTFQRNRYSLISFQHEIAAKTAKHWQCMLNNLRMIVPKVGALEGDEAMRVEPLDGGYYLLRHVFIKDGRTWNRKCALIRHRLRQCLDLGPLNLRATRIICCCLYSSRLWDLCYSNLNVVRQRGHIIQYNNGQN